MLFKGLKYIGCGRNRKTYLTKSGKYVVKIPKSIHGEHDNVRESVDYRNGYFLGKDKLARCRLLKNNYLVMEYVQIVILPCPGLPSWTDFVDCRQVGYNRKGKLVAYDWS